MKTIINTQIPQFSLPAYADGQFKTVTDADLAGKWAILFFYPADFTFVCPTELLDMAENYDKFRELGAEVYSVSTDTQFTHKAWHDSSESIAKVKFPMLADKTGFLSDALGVLNTDNFLAYRGTFIVNPQGVIKVAEINDNGIGRNSDELLRKARGSTVCCRARRPGVPGPLEKG